MVDFLQKLDEFYVPSAALNQLVFTCNYSTSDPNTHCSATEAVRTKLAPYLEELNSFVDTVAEKMQADFDFLVLANQNCKPSSILAFSGRYSAMQCLLLVHGIVKDEKLERHLFPVLEGYAKRYIHNPRSRLRNQTWHDEFPITEAAFSYVMTLFMEHYRDGFLTKFRRDFDVYFESDAAE